jgi:uncharacterized protein YbjQ (UPF0145 family)
MKNNFFVSTTDNIENGAIEKYLDVVSSNVVIGTHFFSDFAASFTDVFGGRSETYQNKLQLVYDEAVKELTKKAKETGANGIVGLKMDFGEISGKGKSMLMVSAIGTAVVARFNKVDVDRPQVANHVTANALQLEIKKREIVQKVSQDQFNLKEEDWEYLLQHNIKEIAERLLIIYSKKYYHTINGGVYSFGINEDQITQYLRYTDSETLDQALYNNVTVHREIVPLIKKLNRFSAGQILKLIDSGEFDIAISLLDASQSFYSKLDVVEYHKIIEKFYRLPDKGEITKKKGLMSKEKDIYCCPNGHTNPVDVEFCGTCFLNIKGLDELQINEIKRFEEKTATLNDLFDDI